ncbi:SAM-dependent methyltransferase [Nocardia transvalensis]|uniref:SAM-dependent methyltransferase n=1 Tax=Nocardia transvalensis TaxID=37333 RepID=UPI0018963896|nr:SAM-dependent methyltransferase [Nocardia transvalensis]MBF6334173.1 SAM-dependent methyltransferase [Nocardia transvalensis]
MSAVDRTVPSSARMYDYFLGGRDNYECDRLAAKQVEKVVPSRIQARTNRAFMHRVVGYLAGEIGVRQFLDIGTGIPTEPNLHQIAQRSIPDARVVYVDNDPLVLTHARALMTGTAEGRTVFVQADVREPESILEAPKLRDVLDLSRPVALTMLAVMHFVPDSEGAHRIVSTLVDALAPGSWLVMSHSTADFDRERMTRALQLYQLSGTKAQLRGREEFTSFFRGLDLIEPGVVGPHRWRPDSLPSEPDVTDATVSGYVGVARKP